MLPDRRNAPTQSERILVLGASGMLGHTLLRYLQQRSIPCIGTVRSESARSHLPSALQAKTQVVGNLMDDRVLASLFTSTCPSVVINCVGVVKQVAEAHDPLAILPANALLPHRLARQCAASGARLIHIGTDCVFTGAQGMYSENDPPDARDLYGLSKALGEVSETHALTLRTSIIGPEIGNMPHGLLCWFLSQQGTVRGFSRAIFSGLPTVELARLIVEFVLPRPRLHGIYHVAAEPINKFELLELFAQIYNSPIAIHRDETLIIDRSLDGTRFCAETGYRAPKWPELVTAMKNFG